MNSKQRAFLKSLASNLSPIMSVGKDSVSPELTEAVRECFNTHELIKINVLNNCMDDPKVLGSILADRTGADLVQVIGKKIVLYKPDKKNPKIILP